MEAKRISEKSDQKVVAHWSKMNKKRHEIAEKAIKDKLGHKMVYYQKEVGTSVTVQELWDAQKSVIVIYHSDGKYHPQDNAFWPGESIVSPWPNVTGNSDLAKKMKACLKCRSEINKEFRGRGKR